MTRLFILIAVIGIVLIVWHKIKKAKGEERHKMIFWSVISGVGAVLVLLAVTGQLNIITAAIAGMVVLAPKVMRFAQYLPFINRLYRQRNQQQQQAQTPNPGKKTMSPEEAREVLGVKSGSTKEEIILAHRRMMQKMHPDRGGSDYMAAQINKAKETLLG